MTISELMKVLKRAKTEYGDMTIVSISGEDREADHIGLQLGRDEDGELMLVIACQDLVLGDDELNRGPLS